MYYNTVGKFRNLIITPKGQVFFIRKVIHLEFAASTFQLAKNRMDEMSTGYIYICDATATNMHGSPVIGSAYWNIGKTY